MPSSRPVYFSGTGNVTNTRKLISTAQPSESLRLTEREGERERKKTKIIINNTNAKPLLLFKLCR